MGNEKMIHSRRTLARLATCGAAAVGIVLATSAPAEAQGACKPGGPRVSPALLTDISKNPDLADDFLRFGYLDVGTVPTRIARPNSIRAFMTYAQFFEPAVRIEQAVRYVGLEPEAARTFLAIRCEQPNLDVLQPVLAKWPEVFDAILQDFGTGVTCPPTTSTAANELVCLVRTFEDTPTTTASEALGNLYDLASAITGDPTLQAFIDTQYGIGRGFSGLGLAVKGSGVKGLEFTAEGVLDGAIVPEYLVENALIAAAGCHCILVPPYAGRDEARLDPDFVWNVGTPECRTVQHLPSGPTCSLEDVVASGAPAPTPPPPVEHAPRRLGWTIHQPR